MSMRQSVIGRMIRLAKSSQRMPRSLYVYGAEIEGSEPQKYGRWADVFTGRYQGGLVALKRIRQETLSHEVACSSAVLSHLLNELLILGLSNSITPLSSGVNLDTQTSCRSLGSTSIFSLQVVTCASLALGCVVEISRNICGPRISRRLETLIA
jgi:hypothetical protein